MAKTLQIKRGTTIENNAYTGAVGELTMDTSKNTIRIHDGSTQGGTELANTKVNVTLDTTTKAYLLGTSTTPKSSAQAVTSIADTGVYLDTTAGQLTATTFKGNLTGNVTGTATKATADASGNVITETYTPLDLGVWSAS